MKWLRTKAVCDRRLDLPIITFNVLFIVSVVCIVVLISALAQSVGNNNVIIHC
jgi:uncharacterized membrane protein YidH (DUF202 family)